MPLPPHTPAGSAFGLRNGSRQFCQFSHPRLAGTINLAPLYGFRGLGAIHRLPCGQAVCPTRAKQTPTTTYRRSLTASYVFQVTF